MNAALLPTLKNFSSIFDIDSEEVVLKKLMELIDLQYSKDLKIESFVFTFFIFIRITCFHLDDSTASSPALRN